MQIWDGPEEGKITVVCWLWKGFRGQLYRGFHVNALEEMVAQHLTIPHKFVCITDNPNQGIDGYAYKLWHDPKLRVRVGPDMPDCYQRLFMFSDKAKEIFGPKVLSLDLDMIIRKNIDHFITDDPIKMATGKAAPKNGSVWLIKPGDNKATYETFCPKTSPELALKWAAANKVTLKGSDQAWISYKHFKCPTWGSKEGLYHFTLLKEELPENAAIVCFAGKVKPWHVQTYNRFPELYTCYVQAMYDSGGPVPRASSEKIEAA